MLITLLLHLSLHSTALSLSVVASLHRRPEHHTSTTASRISLMQEQLGRQDDQATQPNNSISIVLLSLDHKLLCCLFVGEDGMGHPSTTQPTTPMVDAVATVTRSTHNRRGASYTRGLSYLTTRSTFPTMSLLRTHR